MKIFEKHPMIMIIIGVIGISLSAIMVKFANAPSVVTAAYRLLWTVLLMTPVILANHDLRREILETSLKTFALCALSGIFLALHFIFWFESLNQTSVASSTAIVCTEVVWVALAFCLFLHGKLSRAAAGSIIITVVGSLLIACSDYSSGENHLAGDALALIAALCIAAFTLIGQRIRRSMSTIGYTYIVYALCALTLCLTTWISGFSLLGHSTNTLAVGFFLAVFSTLLGHSIFIWCLKFLSPSFVSASKLCEPVVAAIFAAFVFGEIPALLQIVGGIVTLLGVLIYSRIEMAETAVIATHPDKTR